MSGVSSIYLLLVSVSFLVLLIKRFFSLLGILAGIASLSTLVGLLSDSDLLSLELSWYSLSSSTISVLKRLFNIIVRGSFANKTRFRTFRLS